MHKHLARLLLLELRQENILLEIILALNDGNYFNTYNFD